MNSPNESGKIGHDLALLVLIAVLLPLAIANLLGGLAVGGDLLPAVMRLASHLFFLAILGYFIIFHRHRIVLTKKQITDVLSRVVLIAALLGFVYSSVLANTISWGSLLRSSVVFLFMLNVLLLFPLLGIRGAIQRSFTFTLQRMFVIYAAVVAALALWLFVSGASPYFRLGYPLIPGVFAYYMAIALLISITTSKSDVAMGLFLLAIMFSGSRSAMAFCIVAIVVLRFRGIAILKYLLLGLVAGLVLITVFPESLRFASVLIGERGDFSSGRVGIWAQALAMVAEKPLLGYGSPQVFIDLAQGRELAAHNTLLDLTLTYGLFYALLTYFVWFSVFVPRRPVGWGDGEGGDEWARDLWNLRISLFLLVLFKSLVTNTFWTNMGDAATLFVLLLLLDPLGSLSGWPAREEAAIVSRRLASGTGRGH